MIKRSIPVNEHEKKPERIEIPEVIRKYIDEEASRRLAGDEKLRVRISYLTATVEEGELTLEEAFSRFLRLASNLKNGSAVLTMYTDDKEIIVYMKAPSRRVALVVTTPEECFCGETAYRLFARVKGYYQIGLFSG